MRRNLIAAHGQAQTVLRKCLILFTMLLTVGLSARAADFEVGNLSYYVISEHEVAVSGYIGEPTGLVIPETVENNGVKYAVIRIGDIAFSGCSSLTSVTIPNSMTSIGMYAFISCTSLASITLPKSIISVELNAFSDCPSLEEILVDADNANYCSDNGVLYNKGKTELIQCPGAKKKVTIPSSVTGIEMEALRGSSLEEILVESENAHYCSDNGILYDKDKTELIQCPRAKMEATIPNSVASFAYYSFIGCSSLRTIYLLSPTPPDASCDAFADNQKDIVVYIPEGTMEAYSQAEVWMDLDLREMTNGVSKLATNRP